MLSHREKITCIINHTIILMDRNFTTVTWGAAFCLSVCLRLAAWKEQVPIRIHRYTKFLLGTVQMYVGSTNCFFIVFFTCYTGVTNVFHKTLDGYPRQLLMGLGLKVTTTPSISREQDQNENLLGLRYF